jgi:hypothetical protein
VRNIIFLIEKIFLCHTFFHKVQLTFVERGADFFFAYGVIPPEIIVSEIHAITD